MVDAVEDKRLKLFCPGPTPIAPEARLAAIADLPYHRSQEFYTTFGRCQNMLAELMGSEQLPIILSCSGTGAMEATVLNLTCAGDDVLCINGGKFGARWSELCRTFECRVDELKVPWGQRPCLDAIETRLQCQSPPKLIFVQALETSTGVAYQIKQIAELVSKAKETLLVVDAVSALGAHEINMDAWGIDVLLSGSQKALGLPPGLAFINLSKSAKLKFSDRPRFYFDLEKELLGQAKGQSAYTPAIQLIMMLEQSLKSSLKDGREQLFAKHRKVAHAVREGVLSMGLTLFAGEASSPAITSILLPDAVDGISLLSSLRSKFGTIFAGGQDEYKGRLLRFAHMGFFDPGDIATGFLAIQLELELLGACQSSSCGARVFWSTYHSTDL